ncbi:MAG: M15 family metallopeptidase [Clostridia bacterium]|nr:M15 family metallopeptidase [Clostridia bacterium]
MLPEGFVYIKDVIPAVREDIRYAGYHNFVGCPVDGYLAPKSILQACAAQALKKAAEAFAEMGYGLLIYDAYRPQRAVDHFVRWAKDEGDIKTKEEFYPALDKSELFPKGYIAAYSGHSRGLTVDLTLTDGDGEEIDMGGEFDWFSKVSSHDYEHLTPAQKQNRELLRKGMLEAGFSDYVEEWWHYTFKCDAPKIYYDFPIE